MSGLPGGYSRFLEELKARIRAAQVSAALAVSRELIGLYWDVGRAIVVKQEAEGWGTKVIDRLADDLQRAFPGMAGFSRTNVYRMRAFFLAYASSVPRPVGRSAAPIVPQPVGQLTPPKPVAGIPWGHNVVLLEKVKDPVQRLWYAQQTIQHGWSRNILVHQIESDLYARQGKALTNFKATLPPPQSDLAEQVLKDPYNFDFLSIAADARERELERGLIDHLRKFLLELGAGFSFVGQQYHLEVEGEDFYIDLLFYHLRLRCYVVIELKVEEFKPEFAGKMSFYLSAVDGQLRHADDGPSIGIILCRAKKKMIVEYALRDSRKPMGVSTYRLTKALPKPLVGSLPTVEELEAEFAPSLPPDLRCSKCGSSDLTKIDVDMENMTDGQRADYEVGTWGSAACDKCGTVTEYER